MGRGRRCVVGKAQSRWCAGADPPVHRQLLGWGSGGRARRGCCSPGEPGPGGCGRVGGQAPGEVGAPDLGARAAGRGDQPRERVGLGLCGVRAGLLEHLSHQALGLPRVGYPAADVPVDQVEVLPCSSTIEQGSVAGSGGGVVAVTMWILRGACEVSCRVRVEHPAAVRLHPKDSRECVGPERGSPAPARRCRLAQCQTRGGRRGRDSAPSTPRPPVQRDAMAVTATTGSETRVARLPPPPKRRLVRRPPAANGGQV